MADNYYVRIRGEVKGPISEDQLIAQIRKKRLGRHHEVSTDAVNWMRAGDVPQLFEPVAVAQVPVQPTQVEERADSDDDDRRPQRSHLSEDQDPDATEWFYAKGKNRLGPVTEAQLRMMLATGRVTGSDMVWNESLDDWIEAGNLPQFAGVTGAPEQRANPLVSKSEPERRPAGFFEVLLGLSQGAGLPSESSWRFPNLTRYLALAEGVLRILFVLQVAVIVVGWGYEIYRAFQIENAFRLIVVALVGPVAVLANWLVFLTFLAAIEVVKVMVRIEHNTSKST